tara:strand:- start:513 stop:1472 length:960 start_codon:yes stop_codon:yes gene_type:complete
MNWNESKTTQTVSAEEDQLIPSLIKLSDITEIELLILKRMRDVTIGDHRSNSHGSGFDFTGLRDWQPGDRPAAIDWAQSMINNFSPLVVRDFEQPSSATVVAISDKSLSTHCGVNGVPIATGIARAIATIGLSTVLSQDLFGIVTFDNEFDHLNAVQPRVGKNQVIHCLNAYEHGAGVQELKTTASWNATLLSFLPRTTLLPFISDFLFSDPHQVLSELSLLNSTHDVFVVLVDASFAFELPPVSAGWIETYDIESGNSQLLPRRKLKAMAKQVRTWQDEVVQLAKDLNIDLVRTGIGEINSDLALAEFMAERRLRKVA